MIALSDKQMSTARKIQSRTSDYTDCVHFTRMIVPLMKGLLSSLP